MAARDAMIQKVRLTKGELAWCHKAHRAMRRKKPSDTAFSFSAWVRYAVFRQAREDAPDDEPGERSRGE